METCLCVTLQMLHAYGNLPLCDIAEMSSAEMSSAESFKHV